MVSGLFVLIVILMSLFIEAGLFGGQNQGYGEIKIKFEDERYWWGVISLDKTCSQAPRYCTGATNDKFEYSVGSLAGTEVVRNCGVCISTYEVGDEIRKKWSVEGPAITAQSEIDNFNVGCRKAKSQFSCGQLAEATNFGCEWDIIGRTDTWKYVDFGALKTKTEEADNRAIPDACTECSDGIDNEPDTKLDNAGLFHGKGDTECRTAPTNAGTYHYEWDSESKPISGGESP